jgi:hypothetical protein
VEPTLQAWGEDVVGVIIMGGTNDALANINPSSRKLIRLYNPFLPDLPALDQYPRILKELVAAIYAHSSPFLQIVVMTPPLLGEDPDAPENEAIDAICDSIRELVRKSTMPSSSRERRASSSASGAQDDGRIETVNADGTPLVVKEPAAAQGEQRPGRASQASHHHQHHQHYHYYHHPQPHRHRRLHVIDWNRRMRK